MNHWLDIFDDGGERSIPLINSRYTVGYGGRQKVDVKVYAFVSPCHAVLNQIGDDWEIQNLSAKGTFINGEKVDTQRLKSGDLISLGGACLIVFESKGAGTSDHLSAPAPSPIRGSGSTEYKPM